MQRGRQPCQLVVLCANGKERPNEGEEEAETREGRSEAMERGDEGGKVVGRGRRVDVPM